MSNPLVEQIMREFPFEEVAARMERSGWKWVRDYGARRVPYQWELQETARNLLTDVISGYGQCSTGGLCAQSSRNRVTLWFGNSKKNIWAEVSVALKPSLAPEREE